MIEIWWWIWSLYVTGLLRQLQVKEENIDLFNIKNHGNVFKNWLCPNFLSLPKKSELLKIWEGCSPPLLPGLFVYAEKVRFLDQSPSLG